VRKRLLISTLLVAAVSVVVLGVPLGIVATRLIHDEERNRLRHVGAQAATDQIASVWVVVIGLAVVSLAAAVVLARLQAKRLSGPLEQLAQSAARLGSGDWRPRTPRSGVPEIDKLAQVLDRSAERIGGLLRAEHDLAANASHQLRTPLTALSIRLEEIIATAADPGIKEEAAAALTAAERLTWVVDSLLAEHARSARNDTAEIVDVDEIIGQQLLEWQPAFRRLGRELTTAGRRGLKASATPGILAQVVATLIDNAVNHGDGTVCLRARHSGDHVVIDVGDEGPGIPDVVVPHIFERSFSGSSSTGLGLSLARDLIGADGGRLELTQSRPPIFAIFLTPAADS